MSNQDFNNNNYYSTSDLSLACAISLFYPLEDIDRANPYKAQFVFKNDGEKLTKLIDSYWRKELKVEPQTFFAQLKLIKSRLYSGER